MGKLLNERLEMAYHNLWCYSQNALMTKPKPKFEKEYLENKSKILELENEIELLKEELLEVMQ